MVGRKRKAEAVCWSWWMIGGEGGADIDLARSQTPATMAGGGGGQGEKGIRCLAGHGSSNSSSSRDTLRTKVLIAFSWRFFCILLDWFWGFSTRFRWCRWSRWHQPDGDACLPSTSSLSLYPMLVRIWSEKRGSRWRLFHQLRFAPPPAPRDDEAARLLNCRGFLTADCYLSTSLPVRQASNQRQQLPLKLLLDLVKSTLAFFPSFHFYFYLSFV
jgi:hypothetical protein